MNPAKCMILAGAILAWFATTAGRAAEETVATALYARIGNGYKRARLEDGSFKPEYYALSNGGRIAGTASDNTVDRVTYPEVAGIAMRLLAQHNYHYAQSKEQAKLLLVLHWGVTRGYDNVNYNHAVAQLSQAVAEAAKTRMYESDQAGANVTVDFTLMQMENRVRDTLNLPNAKVLGYLDEINDADGIQRWAGGGDRYNDLLADLEEPRYYIVISAYDFPELEKQGMKKLLWQTRVSVRSPGNSFDQSFVPMMKSAARYFGQDSRRLIRGEESKGTVELGDLKYLGEAKEQEKSSTQERK